MLGLREARLGTRALARDWGFSVPMILTFALAVGINSAAFGLASALIFRPLPVVDPNRVVQLAARSSQPDMPYPFPWSYPDFVDFAAASHKTFSGICLFSTRTLDFERVGRVEDVHAAEVSGDFFGVMGVRLVLGRNLAADERPQPVPDYSVVATRSFWRQNLAGGAIGSSVTLNHRLFTLVGVVDSPALFQTLGDPQIFVPAGAVAALSSGNSLSSRRSRWAKVFARLAPGISLRRAQAVVDLQASRLAELYPDEDGGVGVEVAPATTISQLTNPGQRSPILAAEILWMLASLLLLVACANCANLSLTRGIRRLHEFAVRSALGASAKRLAHQLLVESSLICVAGSALGCASGIAGLHLLNGFRIFAQFSLRFDERVLIYAVALTTGATVLFGLAPLAAGLGSLSVGLRTRGLGPTRSQQGVRRALGTCQVGLCMVLLISGGVALHSLLNLSKTNLGFDPSHLVVADMNFSSLTGSPGRAPTEAALDRLRRDTSLVPGVTGATFATATPLEGAAMTEDVRVPGYIPSPGENPNVRVLSVADDYFRVMHLPIIRGRGFEDIAPGDHHWVVISAAVARHYWARRNPVGKEITTDEGPFDIAGVVGDLYEDGPSATPTPLIYYRYPTDGSAFVSLLVSTVGNTHTAEIKGGILGALEHAVPQLPQPTVEPMSRRVQALLTPERNISLALGVLAAVALLLASVGLFSVLSYDVVARQREFAIRQVFGASRRDVFRMVLRRGLLIAASGGVAGGVVSILVVRSLSHFVFRVSLIDAPSFVGAFAIFFFVTILASAMPARRAALGDAPGALRED